MFTSNNRNENVLYHIMWQILYKYKYFSKFQFTYFMYSKIFMNDTSIVIKTELYQKYNKKITKYRIYKCSYNYDSNNDIINITNIEVIDE